MSAQTRLSVAPRYRCWSLRDYQINESDGDDQDFEGYALDAMADSPGTLESSLSPAGLVSFEGCIIPPLTPPPDFSPENSFTSQSPEAGTPRAQNGAFWEGVVQHQEMVLDDAMEVNNQLQETLHQKQEEINSLQERNHNLRELSCRAKHLATVLDKLMTVRDLHAPDPALPPCDKASLPSSSPRKRRRLSEEDETGTLAPGSVEDILRDISTRCNAVLRGGAKGAGGRQDSESVRMFGAFSGLRTSISEGGGARLDGAEADGSHSSFRTSIKEHCTIRTQVFPHGHAFTSRAQHGGYRFRWVPNHS